MLVLLSILPLILIHGYTEDSHLWDQWVNWLKLSHFNIHVITFKDDDKCGSVQQHAADLSAILSHFKRVNIVAHSKGGLDARWYISHYHDNVANLIMLSTPNEGSQGAYMDLSSCAFSSNSSASMDNMQPNSSATLTPDNTLTRYWAIAGNASQSCTLVFRNTCFLQQNDGVVTVQSALSHYHVLGVFPYNHYDIVARKDVFSAVLPIIK